MSVSEFQLNLPIHECLEALLQALTARDEVVLQAPPGAGKTTQVPLSLLEQPWLLGQKIIVLEPRRVAALNAATRMANHLGEKVGETVGYRMRGATCVSVNTRIEVITEGLLTRWLQDDPELTGVGIVIFDEFHERSMNTDIGLALCLQARELFREQPLKLLIMSATLDGEGVAQLLDGAPIVTSEGRNYPVDIQYAAKPILQAQVLGEVTQTLLQALEADSGSALVFLPGVREIEKIQSQLEGRLPSATFCYPLHGSLSLGEQQKSILPTAKGARKVVLATDIAETSLTIDGVSIVIDAGLARAPMFDPNTGITRLHTQNISMASAEQRAGRAGRTQAGRCYRLWSATQHAQKEKFTPPEISAADLMPLAMTLLSWGANTPDELAWLTPPPKANWQQAVDALDKIDALNKNASNKVDTFNAQQSVTLSEAGQKMAGLPCHPRLAKLLLEADKAAAQTTGTLLAAILSERTPQHLPADISALTASINNKDSSIPRHWLKRIQSLAKQLGQSFQKNPKKAFNVLHSHTQDDDLIGLLLASAFPERIAKKKYEKDGIAVFQLANGRAAQAFLSESLAHNTWIVITDLGGHAGKRQDNIFTGAPLDESLFEQELSHLLTLKTIAEWREDKHRFIAEKQTCIGHITIKSERLDNLPSAVKRQALIQLVRNKGIDFLTWDDKAKQLQARMQWLHECYGDTWPSTTETALLETLEQWLAPFLDDINTLNDFKKIDIYALLKQQLTWPQPKALDELTPESIPIPSGRHAAIDYTQNPPVLAVKLQEMFGCQVTPAIVEGKVPLMLHLLSPAKRPLQVTQDLTAFWGNAYQDVKKEMKGRYPKHPWPDDPTTAVATRHTKKRKLQ